MRTRFTPRVEWELTRACGLRCRHCHQRCHDARPRELDTDEALAVAAELGRWGCEVVTLSGGEPTDRADWPQVAVALSRAGVAVQLVTNGQRIGRIEARLARAAGIGAVQLSVDGMGPTHDWLRRREGAFEQVERAAEALRDAELSVGFTTTLLSANVDELEELADWVTRFDPVSWQVWLGIPQDRSALWLRPRHQAEVVERLQRLQKRVGVITVGDNVGLGACGGGLRRADELTGGGDGAPALWRCGAGEELLGIRSDGSVTGCLALPDGSGVGNLRQVPLPHLWRLAGEARARRVQHLSGGCGDCARADQCEGGCHAMALATTGKMDNPFCLSRPLEKARPRRQRLAGAAASVVLAAAVGACGPRADPDHATPPPVSGAPDAATPKAADATAPRTKPADASTRAAAPPKRTVRPMPPCMYSHVGCFHLRKIRARKRPGKGKK